MPNPDDTEDYQARIRSAITAENGRDEFGVLRCCKNCHYFGVTFMLPAGMSYCTNQMVTPNSIVRDNHVCHAFAASRVALQDRVSTLLAQLTSNARGSQTGS